MGRKRVSKIKIIRARIDEAKSTWHWELAEAALNLQLNLYERRKAKGWTQRQVGEKLGVKQPHIVRHETWGYMPSMDSLAKYAHLYECSIADLLSEPKRDHDILINDDGEIYGRVTYNSPATTTTRTVSFAPTKQNLKGGE